MLAPNNQEYQSKVRLDPCIVCSEFLGLKIFFFLLFDRIVTTIDKWTSKSQTLTYQNNKPKKKYIYIYIERERERERERIQLQIMYGQMPETVFKGSYPIYCL